MAVMRRNDRPEDQNFDLGEPLFYRVNKKMADRNAEGGVFIQFKVENDSVNRSKHGGEAQDVLLCNFPEFHQWGIVTFAADELPDPLVRPNADTVIYRTCHDPKDDNYYHCEIRLFRNSYPGERVANVKAKTKSWFRQEINKRLSLIREPQV